MSYCKTAIGHPLHGPYHDREYGFPVRTDAQLFERLVLEINQAGLSWLTILQKRGNFRRAFDRFDLQTVAAYGQRDRKRLLADAGIIRNRLKVNGAVTNAQLFLAVQEEFGSFSDYAWRFVGGKPMVNELREEGDFQSTTAESDALSKDLRQRGFKFVGPTIIYAHMQATGMVNDHTLDCFRRQEIIEGYGRS